MRLVAALLVACLVPPVWIAARGGADVDLPFGRPELYRATGPALALFGAVVVAALPAAAGRRRWLHGTILLLVAISAILAWGGSLETSWIRASRPGRLAEGAALLGAVAVALARGRVARAGVLGRALPGAALGLALTAAVYGADRADLDRRIAAAGADAHSPDVLFLLVDTLRADALGAYGARPSPSPFLDAFAARSVVFERALSQAQWTAPSVSSLLSSLYPSTFLWSQDENLTDQRLIRLPAGIPWLPEHLSRAGYHTAAFVKNPLVQGGTRFGRGFHVHEYVRGDTAERHSAHQLVDAVLRWGDALADHRADGGEGAYFAYVHFMDPHARYEPPAAWHPPSEYEGPIDGGVSVLKRLAESEAGPAPADLARVRELYRAEVAYLDAELARLRDGLAARGLWTEDTVVVLVSDHGEQFFEHGAFFHGHVQWENLHVPFVFHAPGIAPRRVPGPVAMLDVAPTLLEWLGLPVPETMEGRSLVPQLRGAPLPPGFVVSERVGRGSVRTTGPAGSLVLGEEEAWFESEPGRPIDLDAVPPEARPRLDALRRAHEAWVARPRPRIEGLSDAHEALEPDEDTAERLRALGYVE